jgi:hypothetical protein
MLIFAFVIYKSSKIISVDFDRIFKVALKKFKFLIFFCVCFLWVFCVNFMVACLRIALQFAVSSRKSKKNLLKNYFQLFIIGKNFPKCFLEVSKSCFRSTCRGAGGCNANPGLLNVN